MQQTDGTVHKLKPRSFHQSTHLKVYFTDFHSQCELCLTGYNTIVEEVLRRMAENNLFVKPEKCVQKIREVVLLKVRIGPDRIKMEKEKVQEVVDWPVLRSMKNVQNFLELANYYKQFVKDFTRIAKPLHKMMRKDVKQNWRESQQKTFEELKGRFITELVLVILE